MNYEHWECVHHSSKRLYFVQDPQIKNLSLESQTGPEFYVCAGYVCIICQSDIESYLGTLTEELPPSNCLQGSRWGILLINNGYGRPRLLWVVLALGSWNWVQ